MLKKLIIMFGLLFLMVENIFAVTITYTTDYGIKNCLLFAFLIIVFLFWFMIYKNTEEIKFDKENLMGGLSNLVIKFVCLGWMGGVIYISQSVLLISSNPDFLLDKLDLIYILAYTSIVLLGFVGLLKAIKVYNSLTGTSTFWREFVYEIKTGGRK